jgi:hypothetical protein
MDQSIDFSTLNQILEILCNLICNRVLYSSKDRMTVIIKNNILIDLFEKIEGEQPIFLPVEIIIKNQPVSLNLLKDIKRIFSYFENANSILSDQTFENVLKNEDFLNNIFKPICSNSINILKHINRKKSIEIQGKSMILSF